MAILGGGLLLALHLLSEYGLYGSLRYVHHRDFRSVSIDLQRTCDQYTSGDIGAALPRASRTRPLLEIGLWQPARTVTAKLGTMGTAAAILPPLIIALFALGVPLITLVRWIAIGGARV